MATAAVAPSKTGHIEGELSSAAAVEELSEQGTAAAAAAAAASASALACPVRKEENSVVCLYMYSRLVGLASTALLGRSRRCSTALQQHWWALLEAAAAAAAAEAVVQEGPGLQVQRGGEDFWEG